MSRRRRPEEPGTDGGGPEVGIVGPADQALCGGLRPGIGAHRLIGDRVGLVDVALRRVVGEDRLGAGVDEPVDAAPPGGRQSVLGAVDVGHPEGVGVAPLVDLRGEVEDDVAAGHPLGHRVGVGQVAADWLGAAGFDRPGGFVGAGQGASVVAVVGQRIEEAAADEAGTACDEGIPECGSVARGS